MKKSLFIIHLFFTFQWAIASDIPKSLDLKRPGLVPIDILETQAKMIVNKSLNHVTVETTTQFKTLKSGKPVLFLRMAIDDAQLNGRKVDVSGESLFEEENSASSLNRVIPAGTHTLTLKGSFLRLPQHDNQFIPINYINGDFIEESLPANFMYDFYKLSLDIEIASQNPQMVVSNGLVSLVNGGQNTFKVNFPESFNSSYFFLDILPANQKFTKRQLTSGSGKKIPLNLYLQHPGLQHYGDLYMDVIEDAFHELEAKLGPYPYDNILFKVLQNGDGGAFAGAMTFDPSYLRKRWMVHELSHSWFLKGVSPVNGYDAWFHEGFAEWARDGFPTASTDISHIYSGALKFRPNSLRQNFPSPSWDKGKKVLSFLDNHLSSHGGLLPLMIKLHDQKKGTAVSTADFFQFISQETGQDLTIFFDHYFN